LSAQFEKNAITWESMINQCQAQVAKTGKDILELDGIAQQQNMNVQQNAADIQSIHNQLAYTNTMMEQVNQLNAVVESYQVRLHKLEAYEQTSAKNLQDNYRQLQEIFQENRMLQQNDDALQQQHDFLQRQIDEVNKSSADLDVRVGVLEDSTWQLNSKDNKNEGFEREVHQLLDRQCGSVEAHESRLRKLEVGGVSIGDDPDLKIRLEKLNTNYDIMHVRLKGLEEYSRGPMAEFSTEGMHNRLEQLCAKQEGECMARCHQVMELESRWARQFMEIRATVEKERMDFNEAIGKSMGPIPLLVTADSTTELPGMPGAVNAFCVVEIPEKIKFQTLTKPSKLPTWDEGVEVNDFQLNDSINFTLYDQLPNQEVSLLGRATLTGSEVYADGFEGRLKLSSTPDDVNIFMKIRISKLTGQVRMYRNDVETAEAKHEMAQILENYNGIVTELTCEKDVRINTSMELRDEIMGLLQEERQDRASMCSALEAYFKNELTSIRNA
jgi:hypothetical protein